MQTNNAYGESDLSRDNDYEVVLQKNVAYGLPSGTTNYNLEQNAAYGVPSDYRLEQNMAYGVPSDYRLEQNAAYGVPSATSN